MEKSSQLQEYTSKLIQELKKKNNDDEKQAQVLVARYRFVEMAQRSEQFFLSYPPEFWAETIWFNRIALID